MNALKYLSIIIAAASLLHCTITTVNIPQKTALENQLIGEMAPLSEEEVLLASIRSEKSTQSPNAQPAVAARRRQLFNRDDIVEFKKTGCLGESIKAKLVKRSCTQSDTAAPELIAKLILEENADRNTLITWFIANDPTLAPTDRNQVIQIYHRLLLRQSPDGTPIEKTDNSWAIKKKRVKE